MYWYLYVGAGQSSKFWLRERHPTNLFNHPPAICIEILPKRQERRFHAFFTCNIGKIAPTGARHLNMHQ